MMSGLRLRTISTALRHPLRDRVRHRAEARERQHGHLRLRVEAARQLGREAAQSPPVPPRSAGCSPSCRRRRRSGPSAPARAPPTRATRPSFRPTIWMAGRMVSGYALYMPPTNPSASPCCTIIRPQIVGSCDHVERAPACVTPLRCAQLVQRLARTPARASGRARSRSRSRPARCRGRFALRADLRLAAEQHGHRRSSGRRCRGPRG